MARSYKHGHSLTQGQKLNIEGVKTKILLDTLENSGSVHDTEVVSLILSDIYNDHVVHVPTAYAKNNFHIRSDNIPCADDIATWPHLRGLNIPMVESSEIMMLIGQNVPEALFQQDAIKGGKNEPYAT